ncbi:MAG: DNA methyltransferase [Oscillospiraceae bacterium]
MTQVLQLSMDMNLTEALELIIQKAEIKCLQQIGIAPLTTRKDLEPILTPIIGGRFPYPKSLYAVKDCLRFFVANKPEALVIDFFAGSGTTLHAINLMNAEDGGHRRCIW